ncbi:hypothetical protein ACH5RR_023191 [Cinchona calisaya]|uniref:Uncharacterized protein n=1 Tax=Cinchona calisaya TaxID=153742 RepID=A0ABD2ZB21_9GENT
MSQADVSYSCGSCGYPLNLTSSTRATSGIGLEYKKSIKKGFISFISIDISRFTQVDEVKCLPISLGCYPSKTKLLCRKCGVLVGHIQGDSHARCVFNSPTTSSSCKNIMIRLRALQPSEEC